MEKWRLFCQPLIKQWDIY